MKVLSFACASCGSILITSSRVPLQHIEATIRHLFVMSSAQAPSNICTEYLQSSLMQLLPTMALSSTRTYNVYLIKQATQRTRFIPFIDLSHDLLVVQSRPTIYCADSLVFVLASGRVPCPSSLRLYALEEPATPVGPRLLDPG